ncbi:hypothetical protein OC834_004405 [Tilletia horrida]|nr:hypothetical protein OC834_004405 [Tilletia horrida]
MCHEKVYAIVCPICEDVVSIVRRDYIICSGEDGCYETEEWFNEPAKVCCQNCHDCDESDPESDED